MIEVVNGLVKSDGTKVITVEEYDRYLQAIPERMRAIFELDSNRYAIC